MRFRGLSLEYTNSITALNTCENQPKRSDVFSPCARCLHRSTTCREFMCSVAAVFNIHNLQQNLTESKLNKLNLKHYDFHERRLHLDTLMHAAGFEGLPRPMYLCTTPWQREGRTASTTQLPDSDTLPVGTRWTAMAFRDGLPWPSQTPSPPSVTSE